MDAKTMRARLQQFLAERDLSINDWCRRAGIEPGAVYAFMNRRTNDIGTLRLVALAEAEGCTVDQILGRTPVDKATMISLAQPILEDRGDSVTLIDVARLTGLPPAALQSIWLTIDDLVVDAYLDLWRRANEPVLSLPDDGDKATKVLQRIQAAGVRTIDWMQARLRFAVAFNRAILLTSAQRRAEFRRLRQESAEIYCARVLAPARDLMPLDAPHQVELALVLSDTAVQATLLNIDTPRRAVPDFRRRVEAITLGQIVK
ncbi:helix-turn-helix domain-containing protein [Pannonibacter tanglangensis]|uniref:Helix-turn-helix domain-containing protein n=1 Tax=Pannonibacter tanglangensis TaxID=2750084 RepID=A0ABW9ZD37_9HYPH|nr:helix-turn-helix transcriptional regulator [Pannonibacter sp. XCT-34]NBN62750.1 helix-turn-helix domain-containing protein [Pannonibacter sp. XCT-34]